LQADPSGTMMVVPSGKIGPSGSTFAQVFGDGSLIGVVIDSDDLLAGGSVPNGAMALIPEWDAGASARSVHQPGHPGPAAPR